MADDQVTSKEVSPGWNDPYSIVQSHVSTASEEYGVPADLINAVIHSESSFNPEAKSSTGNIGLMQLSPLVAKKYGVTDPLDPVQNIRAGTQYLKYLLGRFKSEELAIAAYRNGETAVAKLGRVPKWKTAKQYVKKVTGLRKDPATLRSMYQKASDKSPDYPARAPSEHEGEFFHKRKDVGGMADFESNTVVLNPYSNLTDEEMSGVALNERARLAMRNLGIRPNFKLTEKQKKAFKNYGSEQQKRETIVGRILSGDPSALDITKEQQDFAEQIRSVLSTH